MRKSNFFLQHLGCIQTFDRVLYVEFDRFGFVLTRLTDVHLRVEFDRFGFVLTRLIDVYMWVNFDRFALVLHV